MNTLFDFLTHVKGVEYLVALLAIGGFILYWEVFKPRPFSGLVNSARDDMGHIRSTGYRNTLRSVGKVATAPFIGIAYVAMLPLSFVLALGIAVLNLVGRLMGASPSFGWRPVEAYFTGRRMKKKKGSTSGMEEREK
jgi:hypothetical protein